MDRSETWAPLRVPNFRWYFASRLVNTFGTTMATVALAFAVLDVSDNPSALGWVLAGHTIPMVALLLFGGVLADRFSRATVLQWSNVTSALTQGAIAALVLTGHAEVWHLVVLSVAHGAASGVGFPAMSSMMPSLVPTTMLQQANALVSLTRSGMAVIGPSLGALLVVHLGSGWALAVDASTWAFSALLLTKVRLAPVDRTGPVEADGTEQPVESTWQELKAGWSYVRRTRWFHVIVLGFGLLNAISVGAIATLGPVVAQETIGRQAFGWVLSAEAVGFVVMTLFLLKVRLERPLVWGLLGVSLMALPMVALGAHPVVPLLLVAAFVAGAGTELFGMGWNLAMQEQVPPAMLSRAYSYDALGSFVAMPIGQLAFGPLGHAFGNREVLVVSGVVYALVALAMLTSGSVRAVQRAQPATPDPA